MATVPHSAVPPGTTLDAVPEESWVVHPVNWTAVWVGTLVSVAAVLLFGLVGVALGAHLVGPEYRVVALKNIALGTLAFSIFSAFLAFVVGGWVAGTVGGVRRAEPAIFHGVVTWLVTLPILVLLAGLGAGSYMGAWYGGAAGTPGWAASPGVPFDAPDVPFSTASETQRVAYEAEMAEYRNRVKNWREETPRATRNAALGALTALLLGLMGSVIGGWMASGETMTFNNPRPVYQPSQKQRVLVP